MIRCKRVYEAAAADDGQRVLVDRLWPRNLRKENLHAQWLREVAPSDDLRKALHQGEVDFAGFTQRYQRELAAHPEYWYPLLDLAGKGPLTLLYAGKDTEHNNARVLAEWLESE
ncbi:MAG: DUF488 family protein, partial [Pseudomonas sp.]